MSASSAAVASTEDATETDKLAAIRRLALDSVFQEQVRSDQGIPWGAVQSKLADYLPDMINDRLAVGLRPRARETRPER